MTLWEIFCTTGKIDDYLNYKQSAVLAESAYKERSAADAGDNERSGSV